MNEIYYNESLLNKSKYIQKHKKMEDKVNFYCNLSQNYNVEEKDNKFYFFNPFSVQIFMKVIENILEELYKNDDKEKFVIYSLKTNL